MRKLIAFVLVLSCCAGLLLGSHRAVMDMEDQTAFTEEIVYGDASVLAGRSVELSIICGNHMTWNSEYFFGTPGSYETEFVFTQGDREQEYDWSGDTFSIYLSGGFGVSSSSLTFTSAGFGSMIRAVAEQTPDGGELEMDLLVSDYMDCYPPSYYINYESDEYYCYEQMDMDESAMGGDSFWGSNSYYAFNNSFRFPVGEGETVHIGVTKDSAGNIVSVDVTTVNPPELEFIAAMNDAGCCLLPVFRSYEDGTPLEAEYPDGYGIYFVPWKKTGDTSQYSYYGTGTVTKQEVIPDYANARNIYPLDSDTLVRAMEVNDDGTRAWLLTEEDGLCVLAAMDLENQVCLSRVELFEANGDAQWLMKDGWMVVFTDSTDSKAALLDVSDGAELVFRVDLRAYPECTRLLKWFEENTGAVEYNGTELILADVIWRNDNGAFWIMVLNPDGVPFLGEYDCTLLDGNNPSYYSYITTDSAPIVLK